MSLLDYRTLGRSGLAVSPFALGTMTFATARWGTDEKASRAVFDAYVDAGGNFVDTANVYAGGNGEAMLGNFIADRSLRHQLVIATKSGFAIGNGPHTGGNGAKHIHAEVEGSLQRLGTDYIDLYWVHVWDGVTPAEELLHTMSGLVRAGKIRYWGMSNTPSWYVAKLATLAAVHGIPGPIAMQYFYSLVNRDVEDEHIPLAREFGMGMVPWSPLAFGLLTGKYDRAKVEAAGPIAAGLPNDAAKAGEKRLASDGRLDGPNPFGDSLFTPHNWGIVDEVRRIAHEIGESSARVALAWLTSRPGVSSILVGASRPTQLVDNIAALDLALSVDHRMALDAVSASAVPRMLYSMSQMPLRQHIIFGGSTVHSAAEIQ
ncbi:MAG: aldo/keto reductase [Methylobacterium sp.]|nr:MAG: aldo/keto reductase [Methylobacterium sp.]